MAIARIINQIRTCLEGHQLFQSHCSLVVGVSGGSDSLCLLHALRQLRDVGGPALHVAHLDHGFRGEESAMDAAMVAAVAESWNLPVTLERADVRRFAKRHRSNYHAAARIIRYTFLAGVAQHVGADAVAVAHHQNDQAETVLMHVLAGSGLVGLRAMPSIRPLETTQLIRPLLRCTRAEIDDYCAAADLSPRHDPSNDDLSYTRSRLRTQLLPHLAEYNPHIIEALGRMAQICADDYDYIESQLSDIWPRLTSDHTNSIRFCAEVWATLPVSLQRYAIRRAATHLSGGDSMRYEHVEMIRTAVQGAPIRRYPVTQMLSVVTEPDGFRLVWGEETTHERCPERMPQLASDTCPVRIPGVTPLAGDWAIEARYGTFGESSTPCSNNQWSVVLDSQIHRGTFLLRGRRPGDRFRPAGGRGSRRLQDFFVDRKIPRACRAAWPLLTKANEIAWVVGLCADARFQVTTNTKEWVAMRLLWRGAAPDSGEAPDNSSW